MRMSIVNFAKQYTKMSNLVYLSMMTITGHSKNFDWPF